MYLGKVELGPAPRVVMALRDGIAREEVSRAVNAGVDALEFRIDLFSSCEASFVLREIQRHAGVPIVGTIRGAAEGGGWRGSESERLALYQSVLPCVDAVDIEIGAAEIAAAVVCEAREQHKLTIGSCHDFERTPTIEQLAAVVERGKALGVDVVKVAAECSEAEDVRRLAAFMLRHGETPLAVIGMGPLGRASRVFFPMLGSLLTYTFFGEATAPGQLNWQDTLKYLEAFYPARSQ